MASDAETFAKTVRFLVCQLEKYHLPVINVSPDLGPASSVPVPLRDLLEALFSFPA